MGDSDDEYDRRRARDKFRRERSDYTDRRRDRDDRSSRRDDWSDRRREPSWENRRRGDYREFDRGRRDSAGGRHHEMSPPMKRVRRDWDAEPSYHNAGDYSVPYGGVPAHHNTWQHPDVQQMQNAQQDARQQQRPDVDQQSQASQGNHAPAMMTFKQFLNAQDDNIGDEEAFNKYQEYKLEFRKTQMSDFFQQHKEEEWFRTKYHPKESAARQKELKKAMKRRLSVFLNLLKSGRADAISLDIDNSDAIVKLLDAVVIKLEGGTDSDLAVLECPPTPPPERRRSSSNPLMSPNGNDPAEPFEEKKDGTVDETVQTSQNDKDVKKDSIVETGPVSPSSVPLPSAPPPASAKATAKKEENGDVKMMSVANPTPEQQQLQQQAQQYYHQQQLYYQQQYGYGNYDPQQYPKQVTQEQQQEPQTSQSQKDQAAPKATKKEDEPKKKRKRRHREPYYYDAMDDESESESESDSEPEPAPPGEEMSPVETGKEKELLPPGVEAETPSIDENLLPPGVDAPKPSEVETSEQLPTSSSNSEKQPSATTDESKPDSGEPAVGSSQPESISGSNGVSQGGKTTEVETAVNPQTSDDTAADSTQDPNTKETKQTFPAETSSIEQAESSSSSVAPPEKDSDLVGSTVNGNNTVTAEHQEAEMIPESSSEAQEKPETPVVSSMEAEPSSLASSAVEPSTQALSSEEKPEQVDSNKVEETKEDSNKLSEKKEAVEETTPVKEVVKDNKENATEEKEKDTAEEPMETDESKQLSTVGEPRALHKTFSLFMRSVPPGISKADIAAMCKRFAGFLRVALSDPSPDRKFFRRGWITFDRSVNIKEICWELNNLRVKDTELSPVVNRDLSRRVRGVSGAATAKQVIRDDIKLAAKLIRELDKRASIYEKESKEETEAREKAEKEAAEKTEEGEECEAKPADDSDIPDLPNENPILASLSEDATEEEGGEEMELMGTASPTQGESGDKPEVDLSRDSGLLRVLDRLVLYLRVVHSLDYYNGLDYPYEDEMPNRCGIIHVRGATPEKCTLAEVQEWQKGLNQRLEPFWQEKESLKDEEVVKLGKKDPEAETERFVEANTQELAKDKWLCPLSGKKFRGPDFVRKHIFNKHMDKVEAVRMEAEFFNRYLSDPKRPQMPEAPASQRPPGNQMGQMYGQHQHSQGMMGWGPRPQMMMYGPRGPYTPPSYGGYGHEMYGRGHTFPPKPRRFGYGGGGRNKGGDRGFHRDPRTIIQYKDLDAPDDADAF